MKELFYQILGGASAAVGIAVVGCVIVADPHNDFMLYGITMLVISFILFKQSRIEYWKAKFSENEKQRMKRVRDGGRVLNNIKFNKN